jgi:transcription elongation factor Elf1
MLVKHKATKFFCPICGRQGLIKHRQEGVSVLYCEVCTRELMVILDPVIQNEDNPDVSDITTH